MVEALHPVTIKIPESTYQAAKKMAEVRGYFSVEELLSEWLEVETASVPMTPQLAAELEKGLADSRANNVISIEEHNHLHQERRAAWIKDQQG